MQLRNTTTAYGWAAIWLHWISAIGVVTLYFLGDRIEDAPDRAGKLAAQNLHVSVGLLLFTFLAARILWTASQETPRPLERNRWLRRAARAVHGLFLLMIAVLIVSGPLALLAMGGPIPFFGLFTLPNPTHGGLQWLHETSEEVHRAATSLFWPLIALHVAGALKHLVIDRDGTLQRMLWVRRG